MNSSTTHSRFTTGELLAHLRRLYGPDQKELARALQMSHTTYLKTERGLRELSFLMALRLCQFYQIDLHEFISMLSDEELSRNELSVSKALQIRARTKEAFKESLKSTSTK